MSMEVPAIHAQTTTKKDKLNVSVKKLLVVISTLPALRWERSGGFGINSSQWADSTFTAADE